MNGKITLDEASKILGALDTLGAALSEHDHQWTDGERTIYEQSLDILQRIDLINTLEFGESEPPKKPIPWQIHGKQFFGGKRIHNGEVSFLLRQARTWSGEPTRER